MALSPNNKSSIGRCSTIGLSSFLQSNKCSPERFGYPSGHNPIQESVRSGRLWKAEGSLNIQKIQDRAETTKALVRFCIKGDPGQPPSGLWFSPVVVFQNINQAIRKEAIPVEPGALVSRGSTPRMATRWMKQNRGGILIGAPIITLFLKQNKQCPHALKLKTLWFTF